MEVCRSRASRLEDDFVLSQDLIASVVDTDAPAARVWCPPRHVSFGPRDVRTPGYQEAMDRAREAGYAIRNRELGGRAVAFTGETVAMLVCEPAGNEDIGGRYERYLQWLEAYFRSIDLPVTRGEPAGSFCPGSCSLSIDGKVVGLAQRVRADVAMLGGVILVDDTETIAEILGVVYPLLGLAFDEESVDGLARHRPDLSPDDVCTELATMLSTDRTF